MLSQLELLKDLTFYPSPAQSIAPSGDLLYMGHEDGKLTITNVNKKDNPFKSIEIH